MYIRVNVYKGAVDIIHLDHFQVVDILYFFFLLIPYPIQWKQSWL